MNGLIYREMLNMDWEKLKGFTVVNVLTGTNASGDSMSIKFEREVVGGTICVNVDYNNEDIDGVEWRVSEEYIKP